MVHRSAKTIKINIYLRIQRCFTKS